MKVPVGSRLGTTWDVEVKDSTNWNVKYQIVVLWYICQGSLCYNKDHGLRDGNVPELKLYDRESEMSERRVKIQSWSYGEEGFEILSTPVNDVRRYYSTRL